MFWVSVVVLSGCDFDGDGLGTFNESQAGTANFKEDTDGDGLSDGDEVLVFQTDPNAADSDGDGAQDGLELDFGFDPLDVHSGPYSKGWPMTLAVSKDALSDAPDNLVVGRRIRRTWSVGKDEELVDLYDYAEHGKPILLMAGNAGTLGGESDRIGGGTSVLHSSWVVDQIESQKMLYLSVATMGLRPEPRPPEIADIRRCEDVPYGCFADMSWDLFRHIGNEDLYTAILLDEEMVVLATSSASNQVPLDAAVAAALGVPPPE